MSHADKLLELRTALLLEKIVDFDGDEYDIPPEEIARLKVLMQRGDQFRVVAGEFEGEDVEVGAVSDDRTYRSRAAYSKMVDDLDQPDKDKLTALGIIDVEDFKEKLIDDIKNKTEDELLSQYGHYSTKTNPTRSFAAFKKFLNKGKDLPGTAIKQAKAYYMKNSRGPGQPPAYAPKVAAVMKDLLAREYINNQEEFIDALQGYPKDASNLFGGGTEPVPEALKPILDYVVSGGGTSVGAGEIIVPLLFTGGEVVAGNNPTFDVRINGEGWHVKAANPADGIRFGSAQGKMFADSRIQSEMLRIPKVKWMQGDNALTEAEYKKIRTAEMAGGVFEKVMNKFSLLTNTAVNNVYTVANSEAIDRAIPGDAVNKGKGTIWVHGSNMQFVPRENHRVQHLTQGGRYVFADGNPSWAGSTSYDENWSTTADQWNSAISALAATPQPANAGHRRSGPLLDESLLGLRVNLLIEELTRSDKKDIQRMIAKHIEADRTEQKKIVKKEIEAELKKSLGKGFFGSPGKINKAIQEIAKEQLKKEMKGGELKNAMADVTKLVLRKLYRELAYSYTPVIDRIKI